MKEFTRKEREKYEFLIARLIELEKKYHALNSAALDKELRISFFDLAHSILRMGEFQDVQEVIIGLEYRVSRFKKQCKAITN